MSFKESRVGPGARGGSGSSEPPRRLETGVEDEGEGEAEADSLEQKYLHVPHHSELLHRSLSVSERDKAISIVSGFAWVSLKAVLAPRGEKMKDFTCDNLR